MPYREFDYIQIDDRRIDSTCEAYFKWKDLNTYIKNHARRGLNIPDAISEPIVCYSLGFLWNRRKKTGDATNPITGERIEVKATSRFEGDLSSFGPKCVFDNLIFLRLDMERNLAYIYDLRINSEDFGKLPANATETIEDQKKQKRRPRVSLLELFVYKNNLTPDVIFDIRRCKVFKPGTDKYNEFINVNETL